MIVNINGTHYDTSSLKLLGEGGEGKVYRLGSDLALKVFDEFSQKMQDKLNYCLNFGKYKTVAGVAAVPKTLVVGFHGRIQGYTMRLLEDCVSVADMASLQYCVTNRITLRKVGVLFIRMHEVLEQVHEAGFLVGDYRGSNIKFNPLRPNLGVTMMDVDSWAYGPKGIHFNCTATHPSIRHPLLKDLSALEQRHDWYAYAHELAKSLLKCGPFELGFHPRLTTEQRQEQGITCWSPQVQLMPVEKLHSFRFGDELTDTIKRWLATEPNQSGVFPKAVLMDFLRDLVLCRGKNSIGQDCRLEFHRSLGKCPRCQAKTG